MPFCPGGPGQTEEVIMFRKFIVPLLTGLIVLAAAAAMAGPEGSVRGGNRDRVAVISAKDFNLKSLEGSVVLVGFWQSACEQCESYVQWMAEIQARYLEEGLVIVAVNQDTETSAATDLLNKIHRRTQVVIDPTGRMAAQYELEAMPSTYLYDRNLNMQDKFPGFVPEETEPLEAAIVKLLKKKHQD